METLRVDLHAQIGRLDVFMQSSRRSLAAVVLEGTQREGVSGRPCRKGVGADTQKRYGLVYTYKLVD